MFPLWTLNQNEIFKLLIYCLVALFYSVQVKNPNRSAASVSNMNVSILSGSCQNNQGSLTYDFAAMLQRAQSLVEFPWFIQSLAEFLKTTNEV